jgi:anion-transporting  ArsA/GET3 family ATPase
MKLTKENLQQIIKEELSEELSGKLYEIRNHVGKIYGELSVAGDTGEPVDAAKVQWVVAHLRQIMDALGSLR